MVGKCTKVTDVVIEVRPRKAVAFGFAALIDKKDPEKEQEEYLDKCEDMAKKMRKAIGSEAQVTLIVRGEDKCEHCGREWTEDDETFNGGCCQKDVTNEAAAESKK